MCYQSEGFWTGLSDGLASGDGCHKLGLGVGRSGIGLGAFEPKVTGSCSI